MCVCVCLAVQSVGGHAEHTSESARQPTVQGAGPALHGASSEPHHGIRNLPGELQPTYYVLSLSSPSIW